MKQPLPEGMLPAAIAGMCLIAVTIAGTVGACTLLTRCSRPAATPMQITDTAATASVGMSQIASQSVKITIRRPIPANPQKTASHKGQEGGIATIPGVVGPVEGQNGATGLLEGNANTPEIPDSSSGDFEEICIEMSQFSTKQATASSGSEASASSCRQNSDNSPIGVILSTAPGCVALDYRAIGWQEIGLDVAANHRMIGAGVSVGGKLFGEAGVFQAFDGWRGGFVGLGARF